MQAYHLEIPDKDYAILLVVDDEGLQVLSGEPQAISALADTDPVRGDCVSVVSSWQGHTRLWFRKDDGSRLSFNSQALSHKAPIGPHTQGAKLER